MAQAHTVAGVRASSKFAAGRRAPFINAARGFFSYLAHQCCAAGARPIRATHATGGVGNFLDQACGDAPAMFLRFMDRKIDAKRGAAGAAAEAGMSHGTESSVGGAIFAVDESPQAQNWRIFRSYRVTWRKKCPYSRQLYAILKSSSPARGR